MSKAELYLSGIAVVLIGAKIWGASERAAGREEQREGEAVHVVKHFVDTVKKVDVRYQHDSIPFVKLVTRYDTTPGIPITIHDTTKIYVEKAVADSVVSACTSLLHSCDIRVALRDSIIAAQHRQIMNLPNPPGFFATWTPRVIAGAAGYGLCAATKK